MTRLRVMHLINNLGYGGAERMLEKLLSHGNGSSFSWKVVSLIGGGALEEPIRDLGVPVENLGMRRGIPDPRALLRFLKVLRKWKPQILQTWLYHSDFLGALALHLAEVPHLVWNIRGTGHLRHSGKRNATFLPKLCAGLAGFPDLVLSNSHAGVEFHQQLGYRPRRWEVIPNGFDLERFRPDPRAWQALRRELDLSEESLVGGFIGRWSPSKDHSNFFKAARSCLEECDDLVFVLAGPEITADNASLTALLKGSGVEEKVRLLGARADIPHLCAGFDFFVLPSLFEGFPNVLGEAMACGVPCVATRAGDAAEILGDCGILVPPGDSRALARAMEKMAALPAALRAEMGARGRSRIKERFEIRAISRRYEALYARIAGERECVA
ncbi:MAG: glycosyltransferase family 4 protein [Planctomycetota bacterium]